MNNHGQHIDAEPGELMRPIEGSMCDRLETKHPERSGGGSRLVQNLSGDEIGAVEAQANESGQPLLEHYSIESRRRYSDPIEGFIAFGMCLIEAKTKLSHEEWKLFTNDTSRCPVTGTVANRFMTIARNVNIGNRANWNVLPLSWNVLYEIALLTDQQFEDGLRQNAITPESTMNDIRRLRGKTLHSRKRGAVENEGKDDPAPPDPEEVAEIASVFERNNVQSLRQESRPSRNDENREAEIDLADPDEYAEITLADSDEYGEIALADPDEYRAIDKDVTNSEEESNTTSDTAEPNAAARSGLPVVTHRFLVLINDDDAAKVAQFKEDIARLLIKYSFMESRIEAQ